MKVSEALTVHKSVRTFLDRPVARTAIERIIDRAHLAPSGTNTQPWEVVVAMREAKREVCRAMEAAYLAGQPGKIVILFCSPRGYRPFMGCRNHWAVSPGICRFDTNTDLMIRSFQF